MSAISSPILSLKNVWVEYGDKVVLEKVDLDIEAGSFVSIVGPSGAGKSSLLRIILGQEQPTRGTIMLDGTPLAPECGPDRGVVFQRYSVFPHLSALRNTMFGLECETAPLIARLFGSARTAATDEAAEMLKAVGLGDSMHLYPAQLSGGMQQRLAIAQALIKRPRILLLDEPFGALDAKVRKELRRWLRRLHDELHVTSVFVTHDQEEALEVADQVVLMNRGKVEQFGTPEAVYNHPATPFVFGFLGNVNLFHGRLEVGDTGGLLHTGEAVLPVVGSGHETAGDAVAYVRPHDLEVERYAPGTDGIAVTLRRALTLGPVAQLELEREDNQDVIEVALPLERFRHQGFREGELLAVRPRQLRVFNRSQTNAGQQGTAK